MQGTFVLSMTFALTFNEGKDDERVIHVDSVHNYDELSKAVADGHYAKDEPVPFLPFTTVWLKCVSRRVNYSLCCAYVILQIGKNIFTFICLFVNLYLLLSIVNQKFKKMKSLLDLPQPKAHFAMTGFNVIPIKIDNPIPFKLYGKYDALIVSTNGLNIRGEKTFGVKYGPENKWYTKITENELA